MNTQPGGYGGGTMQSYGGGGGFYGGGGGGVGDAYADGRMPEYDDGGAYGGGGFQSRNNYGGGGMGYDQPYYPPAQKPSMLSSAASGRMFMKEFWVNCLILEAERDVSSVVTGFVGGLVRGGNYSDVRYVDDVAPVIRDRIRQVVAEDVGWDCDARLAYLPPHSGGSRDRWAPTMQVGSQTLMVFRCQLMRRHDVAHGVCCCCCDFMCPPENRLDNQLAISEGVQQLLRSGKPKVKAMIEVVDGGSQELFMAEKGWCDPGMASECVERARRERGYGTGGGGGYGGSYGGSYGGRF
mmetsp:Transcript_57788/g.137584  ORF Transcript_57788/g.137584 Transcript_57788/m.137584 type:complete len:295 (-) Transcript_57788:132-1016(-)